MFKKYIGLIVTLCLISYIGYIAYNGLHSTKGISQQRLSTSEYLKNELKKVNSDEALLFVSQGIEDYPLWSTDGETIYVNDEGTWKKLILKEIILDPAVWRGDMPIGSNSGLSSIYNVTSQELKIIDFLSKAQKSSDRDLTLSNGTRIELIAEAGQGMLGLGTTLYVTKKDQKRETIWTSDLENCYNIVASPSEEFGVFLCESNGLILMQI